MPLRRKLPGETAPSRQRLVCTATLARDPQTVVPTTMRDPNPPASSPCSASSRRLATETPPRPSSMDRPRSRARSKAPWAAATLAVVALGATLALGSYRRRLPSVERQAILLGEVTAEPVVRHVSGPGRLVPVDVQWVTAKHRAHVQSLAVEAGDRVEVGSVLAHLSNPELELARLQAERELSAAELQVAEASGRASERERQLSMDLSVTLEQRRLARSERRRFRELARQGALSAGQLEITESRARELSERARHLATQREASERTHRAELEPGLRLVQSLRAIIAYRAAQLEQLAVRADRAGIVHSTMVEAGQWVEAGVPLAKLILSPQLEAELSIDETRASQVAVGQPASLDAGPVQWHGQVTLISPGAARGTVRVTVGWSEAPPGLRPDQRVSGDICVDPSERSLNLPAPAHVVRPGSYELFQLAAPDLLVRTRVQLTPAGDGRAIVQSGLQRGDKVVLSDMTPYADLDRLRFR